MKQFWHAINLRLTAPQSILAFWRQIARVLTAVASVFVVSVAFKALREALDSSAFPEALAVKVEALPLIFPIHMVAGAMALLLVPIALMLRGTKRHRFAGRAAGICVLVAGITAIPVAWVAPVTPYSAAGFIAQGFAWLGLLAAGVWNIRRGHVRAHRACMLMLAAVTSGAVFFRIYLALWTMLGDRHYFATFYSCDAWLAWGLPLLVVIGGLMREGDTLFVDPLLQGTDALGQ